ncbi:hypothetical protein [Nocardia salmonicida]|uniref:hypothetical protein n=1 Tax=Nocardia salmonicida TaxID=53431 RepID=UPI0037996FD9
MHPLTLIRTWRRRPRHGSSRSTETVAAISARVLADAPTTKFHRVDFAQMMGSAPRHELDFATQADAR